VNGTIAMPTGFGSNATSDLTRVGLTLVPPPRRARRIVLAIAIVAAALAAGALAGELLRERAAPVVVRVAAPPTDALQQLRQQLGQAQMGLRVAEARDQELERQIDALNQKLTESQDELTFFRQAREGRKH
jgi:TolA-binding protein